MSGSWRYREDAPGEVQLITIKGVGGLPIFALREDVRYLLSLVAREVRAGELKVYCFAFVRNHAHFVVLSPHGTVYRPMKRVLERFAIYYNRSRGRSGHVFKDRFHSACLRSEVSFFCAVAYVDQNPVKAGLAEVSTEYEFGSAISLVHDRAPPWLDRRRVVWFVPGADPRTGRVTEASYLRTFARIEFEFVEEMLERRRHLEKEMEDPLDKFLSPDRAGRIDWILDQARQADGSTGARLLAKAAILKEVMEERSGRGDWRRADRFGEPIRWRSMLIGLLRLGSARSCRQISAMLGICLPTIVRETRRHIELLGSDRAYLEAAEEVLGEAVRRTFEFLPPFDAVGPDGRTWGAVEK